MMKLLFVFFCSLLCLAMSAPQFLLTNGGVVTAYPSNVIAPRLLLPPAQPINYAAGYDVVNSYEPVEQHGYKISY